jgi:phage tail-like protein
MAPPNLDVPSYQFKLDVSGMSIAGFTAISGLEMSFDAYEYQEGGNNGFVHRLPGAMRHPNLVLTRPITTDKALLTWVTDTQKAAKTTDVTLTMTDTSGTPVQTWTFGDAFPIRWTGPHVESGGSYVAIESVEITHSGLKVQ